MTIRQPRGADAFARVGAPGGPHNRFGDIAWASLLVFLSSGHPLASPPVGAEFLLVGVAALALVAVAARRNRRLSARHLAVLAVFALVTLVQLLQVPGASIVSAGGFFVRLAIGMAVVQLIADPLKSIAQVMVALSTMALVIFSVSQLLMGLGLPFMDWVAPLSMERTSSEALYTLLQNYNTEMDWHRNAGIFWEPGAFAGYCIVGIVAVAAARSRLSRQQVRWWTAVLVAGVISSQSTTGYIALVPAVLTFAAPAAGSTHYRRFALRMALMSLVALAAAWWVSSLPFVRDKVLDQIEAAMYEQGDWQLNRFGTFLADLQDISQRPLTGWGANPRIRPSLESQEEAVQLGQGNGLSNFAARFGMVGFGAFLVALWVGLNRSGSNGGIATALGIFTLLITLVGENFLNYGLYLGLMFLPDLNRSRWTVLVLSDAGAPDRADDRLRVVA